MHRRTELRRPRPKRRDRGPGRRGSRRCRSPGGCGRRVRLGPPRPAGISMIGPSPMVQWKGSRRSPPDARGPSPRSPSGRPAAPDPLPWHLLARLQRRTRRRRRGRAAPGRRRYRPPRGGLVYRDSDAATRLRALERRRISVGESSGPTGSPRRPLRRHRCWWRGTGSAWTDRAWRSGQVWPTAARPPALPRCFPTASGRSGRTRLAA